MHRVDSTLKNLTISVSFFTHIVILIHEIIFVQFDSISDNSHEYNLQVSPDNLQVSPDMSLISGQFQFYNPDLPFIQIKFCRSIFQKV